MTTVFPISSASSSATNAAQTVPTGTTNATNQFGENTFLKLLVAQLKYQDPMSPTDSTQFLTQTAQFTELETLQKIEKGQQTQSTASQMLAAASMVGRQATYALNNGQPTAPTATSVISVRGTLPKDAAVGTHATATTVAYTRSGVKVPIALDFTKTADGWTVQAKNNGQLLGSPLNLNFNDSGDHTNADLVIAGNALDGITGTNGDWPTAGITLAFGDSNDPTRLQLGSGPATVSVAEQNGNDGTKASGVVTGVHLTADGPQLVIGGQDIPLTSITDVQV